VIAQCEAVAAQKAMEKAAKIASMTVEAAKEAGECMASDEFLGFTQAEKGKELEFCPRHRNKRMRVAHACTKPK
jgi:hypothetical protein